MDLRTFSPKLRLMLDLQMQNKFIKKKRKWKTEFKNVSCQDLTSKCDLDLGGRGVGVVHDISSYYYYYLC
jgi:hypothetical protein